MAHVSGHVGPHRPTRTPRSGIPQTLAGLALIQGVTGAYSSFIRGRAERRLAEANARIAKMKARDALKRGREAVAVSRQGTRKLVGSQRAVLAAQGIRLDVGSAQDIQQEALDVGELDALTIQNNALREGFGFSSQAEEERLRGRLAFGAGVTEGLDTLLTGGIRAAGFFDQFKRGT